MGKSAPTRAGGTKNLGALLGRGHEVSAACDTCREWKVVDLARLAEIKGRDYDLWNRHTRCRITAGCAGMNRFYVYAGRGRVEPMRDS